MSRSNHDDDRPVGPKRRRVTRSGREKWEPTGDHNVGYGRPPENTRFGPTHPGNRAGRKPGSKNVATVMNEAFAKKVRVKDGAKVRKLSRLELMGEQLAKLAAQGNLKAIAFALNYFAKLASLAAQPTERQHTRDDEIVLQELQEQLRAMKGDDDDAVS